MSKRRYLVLLWLKAKNVAVEYVENLEVVRTIKAMYKHDKCEVVDMEGFTENKTINPPANEPEKKTRSSKNWATRIRCIETKEEWESVAECHRKTGISFFKLTNAIRKGKAINGLHYEGFRNGKK